MVWFEWSTGGETADAQVFFEFGPDGLITKVTDFWPDSYDPPDRTVGPLERW